MTTLRPRRAYVHRIPQASPDDTSGLEEAAKSGKIHVPSIVAILGKTEGNGCVNDFTRAFAVQSLQLWLRRHIEDEQTLKEICMVMSGGTEGGLSPHLIVFEVRNDDENNHISDNDKQSSKEQAAKKQKIDSNEKSLAIGVAHSPNLPAQDLGRFAQVKMVASTVLKAMAQAGITNPNHVHFVQIKCPLLTAARVQEAVQQLQVLDDTNTAVTSTVATSDTLKSMKLSRGASALGVGVALGELSMDQITNDQSIGQDWSLYSSKASTSGGVELLNHEVVVMGMSSDWRGPLAINHAVMKDCIDVEPIRDALVDLGLINATTEDSSRRFQLTPQQQEKLICLLAKAEASSTGNISGKRHIMLDDSDISSTRHARGFVAGAIAGLVGLTDIFVSGGAEHQGPDGGGPVAVIVDRSQ